MNREEQMQFFYEIFDPSLPRLGPGDSASTRKALDMALSAAPETGDASGPVLFRVLDIGCGNGAQTIELARRLAGDITAVDNHQPFLDELRLRAEDAGVSPKITTLQRDMRALGMEEETFDLIWSEGGPPNRDRDIPQVPRLLWVCVLCYGPFLNVSQIPGGSTPRDLNHYPFNNLFTKSYLKSVRAPSSFRRTPE